MSMEPKTATEIVMRMNNEDQARLLEDMENYKGMIVKLRVNDRQNRFDLGEFEAKIIKWNPTPSHLKVK